jgi:alkanesulfonate monooxygenase SsuD/methylene tetrahydromethanopterin reductase-like flavin-dependent oxidoreductase (luciferase family)
MPNWETVEMKVGIQMPEVEREYRWPEIRDIARTAEDVGFDSLWVGDHLLYRDEKGARGPWEVWSVLAALAEATKRVELGPLVAATSFHNPAMLAKKAVTVDEISGGRLILGLGAGWNRTEYDAYGFAYDNRVSRFEEAFTIIRTLIREGAIDFEGKYHRLREMELIPAARPDLALLIGSNGPRMLRVAAPHVQMWNTWHASYGNTPEGLVELMGVVDEAARDMGRDPAEIERTAAVLVQLEGGTGRLAGSERPVTPPVTGSSDDIAAALHAFSGVGIDHIQLVVDPINTRSVESLGPVLEQLEGL